MTNERLDFDAGIFVISGPTNIRNLVEAEADVVEKFLSRYSIHYFCRRRRRTVMM